MAFKQLIEDQHGNKMEEMFGVYLCANGHGKCLLIAAYQTRINFLIASNTGIDLVASVKEAQALEKKRRYALAPGRVRHKAEKMAFQKFILERMSK